MIKIGELSNITGVSIQAIRFYENEGLISPIEVDRWTNYRYYDESSIERLSEISYLKDLGFSLKEIKNLNEETIKEKISQVKLNIKKLTKNIEKLSTIRKDKGGFFMKNFVNDEKVIGKWKKLAVVKNKEDFTVNKFDDNDIFDFEQIYFLPNGEEYWVFSWTKGILYLKDRQLPYEIIDGKLFIGIVDYKTNTIDNYAIYEKVDNKHYTKEEISIVPTKDVTLLHKKSEKKKNTSYKLKLNNITVPIKKGEIIGNLILAEDNDVIRKIPVSVNEDIKKANIFELYIRYLTDVITGKIRL